MIYSVYNYDTRAYEYYEGAGPRGTHAGTPPMRKAKSELGATPEQASWIVPPGARKVGIGELPRGRIASLAGMDGISADPIRLGLYVLLAYVGWRALR